MHNISIWKLIKVCPRQDYTHKTLLYITNYKLFCSAYTAKISHHPAGSVSLRSSLDLSSKLVQWMTVPLPSPQLGFPLQQLSYHLHYLISILSDLLQQIKCRRQLHPCFDMLQVLMKVLKKKNPKNLDSVKAAKNY